MIPVLPSAALTVRFLTRRFIGEYGDMGECQARPGRFPTGTGVERQPCFCLWDFIAAHPLLPFSRAFACFQGLDVMFVQ